MAATFQPLPSPLARIIAVMYLVTSGRTIPYRDSEPVLTALLRAGIVPPGSLCLTGDCGNCLGTVDGVSYIRTCQVESTPGLVVDLHAADEAPPLPPPVLPPPVLPAPGHRASPVTRHEHRSRVVIVGPGMELAPAGDHELVIVQGPAEEVVGVYPGRQVVIRRPGEVVTVDADEVVIETGRMDIHPVCPGNRLSGILTASAARLLTAAEVDLGDVVVVGESPEGVDGTRVDGRLVSFEGSQAIEAVVVADDAGNRTRHPCDTAIVGLGTVPRDLLARMGGDEVTMRGDVTGPFGLPDPPQAGVVCPCSGVTVSDLQSVADRGFLELELLKRSTLAGTGTCQGAACLPHLRAFVADRLGTEPPSPFTARPLARQMTMAEAAAGWFPPPFRRTSLHETHLAAGAVMDRFGGWWRPWHYGSVESEYWAVREAVSLGDVSTLGTFIVSGPDAGQFLDRLYPVEVRRIADGRSKYVLLLDEAGYVIDDGLVCRDGDRFLLTVTSGGASTAEAWFRDWADAWPFDVRIFDTTSALGAINVTGPHATDLLERVGVDDPPPFMGHTKTNIGDVPCRVFRLSFTGEISYELHHPIHRSPELWNSLMTAGESLGALPHGLDALFTLRLEKGHVLIGMDTEPDSTPRRLGMEWAAKTDRADFVGRDGLRRTDALELDRRLVGLTMDSPAPPEGQVIRINDEAVGHVTSSRWSHHLGATVMLGWVPVVDGVLPLIVDVGDHQARRVDTPFYDPTGGRARA